ncbi:hypothetical protein [Arthrobacter sp. HMWF013]|uniref:hypothetical protein n=1 Tax=Arthrobacter sp. HMWF013 TaxID=2056849 RepID=UPI0015E80F2F|nr:hypothetical protein [Arthrobacter sp. HMWF013]
MAVPGEYSSVEATRQGGPDVLDVVSLPCWKPDAPTPCSEGGGVVGNLVLLAPAAEAS